MTLGRLDNATGDLAVCLLAHAHAAEGVAAMGVETGREQDCAWPIFIDDSDDVVFHRAKVIRITSVARKRNIFRIAFSYTNTHLIFRPGAGITRISVHRRVENIPAFY